MNSVAPLLVLASQSPARASVLRASGIGFEQLVSGVDEDGVLAREEERVGRALDPAGTALLLARAKAEAVAALPRSAGRLVLGCDSVFELEGRAYGKPGTPEVARERIAAVSGRKGVLHTGHWLVDNRARDSRESGAARREDTVPGPGEGEGRNATVAFAEMSEKEIEAYVATGEPLWVAGSFTIEGYGAAFVQSITGESHTVLGLSVNALRELTGRIGLEITDLWVPRA